MNDLNPEDRKAFAIGLSGQLAKSLTQPDPLLLALYSVDEELTQLLELEEDCQDDPEALVAIRAQIEEYYSAKIQARKVDHLCQAIHTLLGLQKAADDEATRFANRADRFYKRRQRIEAHLLFQMQALGVTRIETKLNKLRIQGNGGKQALETDENLPAYLTNRTLTLPWTVWQALVTLLSERDSYLMAILWDAFSKAEPEPNNAEIRTQLSQGVAVQGAKLLPRGVHLSVE